MKKQAGFILAALLFAGQAAALEIKPSGELMTSMHFSDNVLGAVTEADNPLMKGSEVTDGRFVANYRFRIGLDLIASENLSGFVRLHVGNNDNGVWSHHFGTSGVGGPGKAVTAQQAYLNWIIPGTDVRIRMGRQQVWMPYQTFLSPVLGEAVDGVTVHIPVNDGFNVNAAWLRPGARMEKWGTEHKPHGSIDLAYLSLDVSGDGYSFTPWTLVGLHGNDYAYGFNMMGYGYHDPAVRAGAAPRTAVYWGGFAGELTMFDPFRFTADFTYSGNDARGTLERRGWYAALGAQMKMDFGTPFIRGWYASGDDADGEAGGRMLSVGYAGRFDVDPVYFNGYHWLNNTINNQSPAGTWGVQAGLKNVSFIDKLSHTLNLTYFQGTNNTNRITDSRLKSAVKGDARTMFDNSPIHYMTTSDSAWGVELLNLYNVSKELTLGMQLYYLKTNFDENIRAEKYDNALFSSLFFFWHF